MPPTTTRQANQLRPLKMKRRYTRTAPGSVLIQMGGTTVLCTASIDADVPPWLAGKGKGWLTAEYSMLPGSTNPRKRREIGKPDGRSTEIQRLIGRSLRAVTDLYALGERLITVDCDVLEADGGTRTAAINGASVAVIDCLRTVRKELPNPDNYPLRESLAAISVGIVKGKPHLDLDYALDSTADVDMNVVMTGSGRFIELQGSGEEATFSDDDLAALLRLAKSGVGQITQYQRELLGKHWPFG